MSFVAEKWVPVDQFIQTALTPPVGDRKDIWPARIPHQQSAKVLLWETHEGTSLEYLWKLMS